MILHLGGDLAVYEKDIIMIMDAACSANRATREYLDGVDVLQGEWMGGEEAKSLIMVEEEGGQKVYASPISSQTLYKRLKSGLKG